jgi:hypothetical protein
MTHIDYTHRRKTLGLNVQFNLAIRFIYLKALVNENYWDTSFSTNQLTKACMSSASATMHLELSMSLVLTSSCLAISPYVVAFALAELCFAGQDKGGSSVQHGTPGFKRASGRDE